MSVFGGHASCYRYVSYPWWVTRLRRFVSWQSALVIRLEVRYARFGPWMGRGTSDEEDDELWCALDMATINDFARRGLLFEKGRLSEFAKRHAQAVIAARRNA